MIIGKRIKELRKEKGASQLEVAIFVGVNRSAVVFWENEINEPKASYIVKLADFFEVSTDYLLGKSDF